MSRRPLAFIVVGAGGFLVQSAILMALTWWGRWPVVPATALAVECALLANFLWHERWTWRERGDLTSRRQRLLRFHAGNGANSLIGTVALTWLGVHIAGLTPLAANAIAVAVVATANYHVADRWVFRAVTTATLLGALPAASAAADLTPETLGAWTAYVATVEHDAAAGRPLATATDPAGDTVSVPDGTISDWRGVVTVRNRTVTEVVDALTRSGELPRADEVVETRVLARQGDRLQTFMRLKRRALITVTYDTEHDVHYQRQSPRLASSRSVATRIVETDGGDRGFLWRLQSYWRYEQVGPDVRIELRSLSLSRSVPWVTRAIAMPIVNRIGRESVHSTLAALRAFLESRPVA